MPKSRIDTSTTNCRFRPAASVLFAILILSFLNGCDSAAFDSQASIELHPEARALEAPDSIQDPDESDQQEPGVTQKASDLLGKAKSAGSATVQGAGKWVQDTFNSATDTTGKSAEESMKWANETFESLKKQGLTSANSTSEWLNQDWNNMESWQYKVISIEPMSDEALTGKLNELGKLGWECFHSESGQPVRMFFKKPAESYLRHLPFRDMLKLAPLLDQRN